MSNFVPKKTFVGSFNSLLYFEEKVIVYFRKLMVNMLLLKILENTGLKVMILKDKELGQTKKFEDQQLQALLDEDACQTQNQLAERLNVAQQTISNHLQAMGKILKEGKWLPDQLNRQQMEN
uniref:Uncharacterized protein n=1 Tax=Pipistrellus kuhlii TaxID=59472 RepID=A0A7J8B2B1_PIPKU|nr:hypothetical protein mPipKuh1_007835 [Pipistrellus kuhlii]